MRKKGLAAFLIAVTLFAAGCGAPQRASYTVSFESNGAGAVASVTVPAGAGVELPVVVREGRKFTGWYEDSALTGDALLSSYVPVRDTVLYAGWKSMSAPDESEPPASSLRFAKNAKGYTLLGAADTSATELTVPAVYEGLAVTDVDFGAFSDCRALQRLTLPFAGARADGTGDTHFGYLFGAVDFSAHARAVPVTLEKVTISAGRIGKDAFNTCDRIQNITLGRDVIGVEAAAFESCAALTSLVLPDGLKEIKEATFNQCEALRRVEIPEGVESIGEAAFFNCKSLTEVRLPQSVRSIGKMAFSLCSALSELELPENLAVIERGAFIGCSRLESVTVPPCVTDIEDWTFDSCSALISVSLSEGLRRIGSHAFNGCGALQSVTIPSTVTTLEGFAFNGCDRMESIFCRAKSSGLPNGWSHDWNSNCPAVVYWGKGT